MDTEHPKILLTHDIAERLRHATTLLQAVSDHTGDVIFAKDRDGRLTFANPATLALVGKPLEAVLGKTDSEILEDRSAARRVMENDRRIMEAGVAEDIEEVVPLPDGTHRIWFSRKMPYRDEQGKVIGLLGVSRDITERKRAEAEQSRLAQHRQLALDAAKLGWWHYDPVTKVTNWDSRYQEIFGVSGYERPNDEIMKRLHPDDVGPVWEAVERALDPVDPQPYATEYRIFLDDGSMRWVEARGIATFGGDGRNRHATSFVGTVQDISDRRHAEEQLRAAKELAEVRFAQLRGTLDSMTEGLYIVDASGTPVLMNRAIQEMLGLEAGRPMTEQTRGFEVLDLEGDLVPPHDWPSVRVLRGETLQRFEVRVRRITTRQEWVLSYNGAPVLDAAGNVAMGVLTIEDITYAKQTQEALIRSEKLAATGRLAATIAHEINNPLESITNLLYLLNRQVTDPAAREYLEVIDKEVKTLSRISTQTLKFHRENGQPVQYSLAELVGELLEFYAPKAKKHGVTLIKRIEGEGRLFGFLGEIRQVISNLLINAIQATPKGGKITLHLYESMNWRTGERGYRLSIADTGTGIDSAHRARIFEPFFTTKGETGTGLGLWVSMGIISRAKGTMHVWSTQRPGRSGTCFSIFLPAAGESVRGRKQRDREETAP